MTDNAHYEALCHTYFDGGMTLEEEKRLFIDMMDNPALKAHFEAYRQVHETLQKTIPQEPNPHLEAQILARLTEPPLEQSAPAQTRWLLPVVAGVAGLLMIAPGIVMPTLQPASLTSTTPPRAMHPNEMVATAPLSQSSPTLALPSNPGIEQQVEDEFQAAWHDVSVMPETLNTMTPDLAWLTDTSE